jgi:hypothetical protein
MDIEWVEKELSFELEQIESVFNEESMLEATPSKGRGQCSVYALAEAEGIILINFTFSFL